MKKKQGEVERRKIDKEETAIEERTGRSREEKNRQRRNGETVKTISPGSYSC